MSLQNSVDESKLISLAAATGMRLRDRGWMIATVESCTGGLIARALTEIAGSSNWFERGWVTYTNQSKIEQVGVSGASLLAHGAVSEQTAAEMARGGLAHSAAQVAIAVTGIAGPGGASADKPVGTVCFGWAINGRPVRTATQRFSGDRAQVRLQAAFHAIDCLAQALSAESEA